MKTYTRIEPTITSQVGDQFKKTVVIKRYRTDDGLDHEFTTFHPEHRQAAAVIALTDDNQVVISRQFRPGRERYVDDIPGGGLEADESPEQGAKRELEEEGGYTSDDFEYLGSYSWDANCNITSHYFFATDCRPVENRIYEQIEVDQGMETELISIDQLIENAKTDNMTDAPAVLMAYDRLLTIKGEH